MTSFSGFFGGYGTAEWDECQLVGEMWNANGGITVAGQKYNIKLVAGDGKSSLDGYTAATQQMILDQGIKFIAGPSAFFGGATNVISIPNKVIVSLGYNSLDPAQMNKDTIYTYNGGKGTIESGRAGVKLIPQLYPNVKTVAFVMPDDGSIPYMEPVCRAFLKEAGYEMLGATIGYNNETVDFSPIAAKIVQRNPDAMFAVNGLSQHWGNLINSLRSSGWTKPVCIAGNASTAEVLAIAGKDASTDVFTQSYDPNEATNPPALKELVKRMKAKNGDVRAATMHMDCAQALWSLLYVISQSPSLNTDDVRKTWDNIPVIPGTLYGDGNIGGLQSYGIKHAMAYDVPYMRLMKGQLSFVKWIKGSPTP